MKWHKKVTFATKLTENMNNCIVIIPTYNEIENIESIIRAVLSQHKPFHVLVIDDNSPDHTADKVVMLQEEFEGRLFLEKRAKKSGLGTAYVHGFKWALKNNYVSVVPVQFDLTHYELKKKLETNWKF